MIVLPRCQSYTVNNNSNLVIAYSMFHCKLILQNVISYNSLNIKKKYEDTVYRVLVTSISAIKEAICELE